MSFLEFRSLASSVRLSLASQDPGQEVDRRELSSVSTGREQLQTNNKKKGEVICGTFPSTDFLLVQSPLHAEC